MKNAEGVDLPAELDRRLKRGVDQLRQFREAVEELDQIADAIGPLLGVERPKRRGKGASRTSPAAEAQTPSPASKTPSTPSAAQPEDIPEWRKVFPGLSARVPGSK